MQTSFRPSGMVDGRVSHLLYGARKWAAYAQIEGGRQGSQILAHVRADSVADAEKKLNMAFPHHPAFCLQEEF